MVGIEHYGAFLPPFVDPMTGGPLSFLLLCRRPGAAIALNRGSGLVFVGLGAAVLWGEQK